MDCECCNGERGTMFVKYRPYYDAVLCAECYEEAEALRGRKPLRGWCWDEAVMNAIEETVKV